MGISVIVFEPQCFQGTGNLMARFRAQRAIEKTGDWQRSETSSIVLQSWFSEMRQSYPPLADADPDDLSGTEYSFFNHFIDVMFAGPVGERAVAEAWKHADERGLRVVVGGKLLPSSPRSGKRRVHIPALDGKRRRLTSSDSSNASIAILDPAFAPASGTKEWVHEALSRRETRQENSTTVPSGRLKEWHDEFMTIVGDRAPIRCKILEGVVVISVKPSDLHIVAPAAIELASKLRLGLHFFEYLG